PEFAIPTHGEPRHLALYADLAVEQGIPRENITIVDRGDVVQIDDDGVRIVEQVDVGSILVEGSSYGHLTAQVLQDRQPMAEDGLIAVSVALDASGEIAAGPEVSTRGFAATLTKDLTRRVVDAVREVVGEDGA